MDRITKVFNKKNGVEYAVGLPHINVNFEDVDESGGITLSNYGLEESDLENGFSLYMEAVSEGMVFKDLIKTLSRTTIIPSGLDEQYITDTTAIYYVEFSVFLGDDGYDMNTASHSYGICLVSNGKIYVG